MNDNKPVITQEVKALMELADEMVTAADLAPIVHMHPSVIIKYAKEGFWDLCKYQISGDRVKFSRMDFLRKMGFLADEAPEKTLNEKVLEELKAIREILVGVIQKGGKTDEKHRGENLAGS